MTFIKPSIYDTTTFTLEVTGLSKTSTHADTSADGGVNPVPSGLSDVVYKVFWKLTGKEGTDTIFKTGSTHLNTSELNSSNFTPFSDLNNDIVSSWLIDSDIFLVHKYTICNNIIESRLVEDTSVPW